MRKFFIVGISVSFLLVLFPAFNVFAQNEDLKLVDPNLTVDQLKSMYSDVKCNETTDTITCEVTPDFASFKGFPCWIESCFIASSNKLKSVKFTFKGSEGKSASVNRYKILQTFLESEFGMGNGNRNSANSVYEYKQCNWELNKNSYRLSVEHYLAYGIDDFTRGDIKHRLTFTIKR